MPNSSWWQAKTGANSKRCSGKNQVQTSSASLPRRLRGALSKFLLDGFGDGIDVAEDLFGGGGISDFEAEIFVERNHQLQGINRIESHAARAEERLVVPDF